MKKVELVCTGQIKFKELRQLEKDYLEKIGHLTSFAVREFREVKTGGDENQIKKKESSLILEHLTDKDFVVLLDQRGKKMDSLSFASFIREKQTTFPGKIVFIIGGFCGVDDRIRQRSNVQLSFSDMTFAHDLFRILFLEQLFRAFTIIRGMPYHR